MKVAIYARVSTEAQEERQTIGQQLTACRQYCAQRDWEIVAEFKDEAISGSTSFETRPAGRQLLEALTGKQVDAVVIYCVDRLSRNNELGVPAYNALQRLTKGETHFVLHSFDDTPEGELQFTLFMGIATYERKVIRRRMMGGVRAKVEAGTMYRASTPPYGYRYNRETKQLEIREDTAEVVRRIYHMYCEGLGVHAIAARLSELGIPVPSAGTKRQNKFGWHKTRVRHILQSPVYVGRGTYRAGVFEDGKEVRKTLPMPCPPLVDEKLFERVQGLTRLHSTNAKRNTKKLYLLQGLLWCGSCGSRYSSISDGAGHKYYRCSRRNTYGAKRGGHEGIKWGYSANTLDDIVRKFVKAFMERPQLLLPHIKRQVETLVSKAEGLAGQVTEMKRRLEELRVEEDRVLEMGAKGVFKDDAQMFAKLDTVRKAQAGIEKQLKSQKRQATPVEKARTALLGIHDKITQMLVEAQVNDPQGLVKFQWADYADPELKKVIRYLINRIIILDDGKLRFEGVLLEPGAAESSDFPLPQAIEVPRSR